jgi:glutaredoxin
MSMGRWLSAAKVSSISIALYLLPAVGCRRDGDGASAAASASAAARFALPPLVLRDDTAKLLLTWVDEKGDFHVVQKIADVPAAGRSQVRVVVVGQEDGTGNHVYVADLRSKRSDGTFAVQSMPRSQWDEIGASRRKQRLEALLAPPSASAPPGAAAPGDKPPASKSSIAAVIYGAEWCQPCHEAARYLRRQGVSVVEKDIEESDVARAELKRKLERAGLPASASIPIIDVMGRILVGFSPSALDKAVAAARAGQTL